MAKREEVRRKILTASINAALSQGLFTLNEDDDQPHSMLQSSDGIDYDFIAFGYHCAANARGIGWGEISLTVVIEPKSKSQYSLGGYMGSAARALRTYHAVAAACGWLERRTSKYIQDSDSSYMYSCNKEITDKIHSVDILPDGFKTSGKFFR
jgi:hypothetical protein